MPLCNESLVAALQKPHAGFGVSENPTRRTPIRGAVHRAWEHWESMAHSETLARRPRPFRPDWGRSRSDYRERRDDAHIR